MKPRYKRTMSVLLALCLLLSQGTLTAAGASNISLSAQTSQPSRSSFTDVPAGEWYAGAVNWAVARDITTGTSANKFSPGKACTHIEILTFLYRAVEQIENPTGADMEKAVTWAREKGMLAADFDRQKPCSRADAVNYIWQALGREDAPVSSFTDLPANASYAKAVSWAVANGVTKGTDTTKNTFSPDDTCTRGHIVTFLYRAYMTPGQAVIEHYNDPAREGAAFLDTIEPFTGEVTPGELSDQAKQVLASDPHFSELTANRLTVDGTPLYAVCQDAGTAKPLVILLHGGGSSKDETFREACGLACMGLYAVCIDAAGCGDSQKGPLDALASFAETVYQIDTVIEYYNTVDGVDAANFGIRGGSMGGNTAFAYVGHGKYRPVVIAANLGTPDYTLLADGPLYDCFDHGHGGQRVMTDEEVMEFAKRYSPINWPERFLGTYVSAANGMEDKATGPEGCMALEKELKKLGGSNFSFHYFEGYGHEGLPIDQHKVLAEHLLHE